MTIKMTKKQATNYGLMAWPNKNFFEVVLKFIPFHRIIRGKQHINLHSQIGIGRHMNPKIYLEKDSMADSERRN